MSARGEESGLTLVEVLVSLTIFTMVMGGTAGMLIHNSQINRDQQMKADTQANARTALSMIVQAIRSAGWDPRNVGLQPVGLDATPLDSVQSLEVFADVTGDGDTNEPGEDILIQRTGTQIQWRKSSDVSQPFVVLADNITNDADGDGNPESMFVPDSTVLPKHIVVRITARSPLPDSRSGRYYRYTVSSEVAIRKNL